MATSTDQNTKMESTPHELDDGFIPKRTKSRKRKLQKDVTEDQQTMETSESPPKRPVFPPISGDKLTVIIS